MAPSLIPFVAWNLADQVARAAHVAGGSRGRKLRRRALAVRACLEPAAAEVARWYAAQEGR